MSKVHTSMKITNRFKRVFSCYAGDLEHIFKGVEPDYYNAGGYGWNCDLYVDHGNNLIICSGYRNTKGVTIPEELINKYTAKAKKISNTFNWNEAKEHLETNRVDFLKELVTIWEGL